MPAVRDRMVQAAVKGVIEPILEADSRAGSYGFRPQRGAQDAISEVQAQITWGYRKGIDADFQACCASLPHHGIIAAVARRMRDPWIVRLLRRWRKAGILAEGSIRTAIAGTPAGGVVSPVLANASRHAFDEVGETTMRGTRLIRSGDDYVILCRGNPQPWLRRMEGLITE